MLSWGNDQLLLWLKNADYSEDVVDAFRSHNITGLTLPFLNPEELKEMGIDNLNLRLNIMKDISSMLTEKNIKLLGSESSHPIMTQLQSTLLATSLISTLSHDIRDEVISNSESSNKSLAHQFGRLREDLLPILKEIKDKKPLPTPDSKTTLKTHYFPSSPQQLSRESSVRRGVSSRNSSSSEILSERASIRSSSRPSSTEFASINRNSGEISMKTASIYTQDTLTSLPSTISSAEILTASAAVKVRPALVPLDSGGGNATSQPSSSTNIAIPRPSRHHSKRKVGSSNEPLKQLRARTEDKCYKILQAAMKSHGLDISDWKKYALVIVYGGDQERVLGYDEKPVLVFKELNELGLNPSMMLRQVDEEDGLDYPEFDTPGGRL